MRRGRTCALPGTRALPPARCRGGERLHQRAARGAGTTKPPRAAGEDSEDAGAASSILSADAQARAPQPGSGPRRREERAQEEVGWLSLGIRLGGRQGCGRRELLRPRTRGRAGLGRGTDPSSRPPPPLAARRARGHHALTPRVGAAHTRGEAQLPAGRTLRTLRVNDDSAAH